MAAREGSLVAVSFHAELGSDDRVHRMFLELVRDRVGAHGDPRPDRLDAEAGLAPDGARGQAG